MIDDQQTQEGNELVSRIEARALQIFKFTENPAEKRDNVMGFRRFSSMIDDFHQAAEVAEGRLTLLKSERRDELRRYVTQIRAKILKIEIDITQNYLEGLIETQAPLPYGAREFFNSRLKRLGELAQLLSDGPNADGSAGELMQHMRAMLHMLLDRSPELEVFERDPNQRPVPRSRPPVQTSGRVRGGGSGPPAAPPPPKQAPVPQVVRLEHRDEWGRLFLSKGSFDLVTQVCRAKGLSMDNVAGKLGVTRIALTLILNGQDPIPRAMLDVLHRTLNAGPNQ